MDQDPDFSDPDPDSVPIRIWTQEKKADPDPEKKSGSETLHFRASSTTLKISQEQGR